MAQRLSLQNQLLLVPLFQGMSKNELTQLIGQTKLHFQKYSKGKTIRQESDVCDRLMFLLDGEIDVITVADDRTYSVEERFAAPYMLQLEHFFGFTQRHTRTFVARTPCHFVSIGKNDILQLTDDFIILRLNLLNILANTAQKAQRLPWRHKPDEVRRMIVKFFEDHCSRPSGTKAVRIKIAQLAAELRVRVRTVSQELHRMQDDGLLRFARGTIIIPSLERLRD